MASTRPADGAPGGKIAQENAMRGYIGNLEDNIITTKDGDELWDINAYNFIEGDCPPTVQPKLWHHTKLVAKSGLFEVVPGVYQVRGFDLSNLTVIETKTGIICVDPLISEECAAAALKLYRQHRGDRPVQGVIYSHSHADHFGGVLGVLPKDRKVPIVAPDKFMEEALSENVFAGPAMRKRAIFMYGTMLPLDAEGHMGCGLGIAASRGTSALIPPNTTIYETGQEIVLDGVRIVFQMVPDTEAPAELNFFLPEQHCLYIAECAAYCMHNVTTLRGAMVRDAKAWAKYLDEAIVLYGDESVALCSGHLWPVFEKENIITHISEQRDLYAYMHDQTLRYINAGLTGPEISEKLSFPARLRDAPHTQGFYGSLSHNVKGIYQRYMTWFDGNPAHLWPHPPAEEGKRYVECFGGVDNMIRKADDFARRGDLRFAATLLDHAVRAQPANEPAKMALADVLEKLGFGSENATWRNFYLTGAMGLRAGLRAPPPPRELLLNPMGTVGQWLDSLTIKVQGHEAADDHLVFFIHVPDQKVTFRINLSNGALTYRQTAGGPPMNTGSTPVCTLAKAELLQVLQGDSGLVQAKSSDEGRALHRLMELCSVPMSGGKPPASRL